MEPLDVILLMANKTLATQPVGAWEDIVAITFDVGALCIRLESEEGYTTEVPCDDLMELHRLAQISYGIADGYSVRMGWKIPVLSDNSEVAK